MAILETRSIQVKNDSDTINRTNEEWGQFGWNVLSVQVTHSQNTKTYSSAWDQLGGNESQTVETTTINYAISARCINHYSWVVVIYLVLCQEKETFECDRQSFDFPVIRRSDLSDGHIWILLIQF